MIYLQTMKRYTNYIMSADLLNYRMTNVPNCHILLLELLNIAAQCNYFGVASIGQHISMYENCEIYHSQSKYHINTSYIIAYTIGRRTVFINFIQITISLIYPLKTYNIMPINADRIF